MTKRPPRIAPNVLKARQPKQSRLSYAIKAEKDKRHTLAVMAAEFGYKAAERGDNMEQMLRDLETLISEA